MREPIQSKKKQPRNLKLFKIQIVTTFMTNSRHNSNFFFVNTTAPHISARYTVQSFSTRDFSGLNHSLFHSLFLTDGSEAAAAAREIAVGGIGTAVIVILRLCGTGNIRSYKPFVGIGHAHTAGLFVILG